MGFAGKYQYLLNLQPSHNTSPLKTSLNNGQNPEDFHSLNGLNFRNHSIVQRSERRASALKGKKCAGRHEVTEENDHVLLMMPRGDPHQSIRDERKLFGELLNRHSFQDPTELNPQPLNMIGCDLQHQHVLQEQILHKATFVYDGEMFERAVQSVYAAHGPRRCMYPASRT